jgi:hypothetical protein
MQSSILLAIISTSAFSALMVLLLNRGLDVLRRRNQARGFLVGIQLEIAYAEECADAYVTDVDKDPKTGRSRPIWAPNYRVVVEFTRLHLAWLAAEGYLVSNEAHELFRFYTRASEVNRSLDSLDTLTSTPNYRAPTEATEETREAMETRRCYVKCQNMLGSIAEQTVGSTQAAWVATAAALTRLGGAKRFVPVVRSRKPVGGLVARIG